MSQYAGQYPQTCLFVIFRAVWRLQASGITIYSKAKTDGGVADRSVGCMIRASLHAYGGTFDSVTCHQRRYHDTCLRIIADGHAIGRMQRWCCSLRPSFSPPYRLTIPAHPLPGSPQTERICLPYLLVFSCLSVLLIQTRIPNKRKFAKEVRNLQKDHILSPIMRFTVKRIITPLLYNSSWKGNLTNFSQKKSKLPKRLFRFTKNINAFHGETY